MRTYPSLAFSAVFLLSAAASFAEDAADARAARLREVLGKVAGFGEYYPPEPPYPGRVTLEDPAKPDEQADHTTCIATIYGAVIGGRFLVQLASLESRAWTRLPDGNWKMEQWLFRLTLGGDIERAIHRERIENDRHTNILQSREEDIPIDGPRGSTARAKYVGLLDHWSAWHPAN